METAEGRRKEDEHVMIFPFMAKGYMIPLLHLSSALSSSGVAVTFVTTPQNSSFVRQFLPPNPNITLVHLPFPSHPSLPEGCESTDHLPSPDLFPAFFAATELLRRPFRRHVRRLSQSGSLPLCVISDFFLGWTLHECRYFDVPRVVFHGMGVFAMLFSKSLVATQAHVAAAAAGEETFHVPGTPESLFLTDADVPDSFGEFNPGNPILQFAIKNAEDDEGSWGVLVNSFTEMESDYVAPLMAHYKIAGAWLAGPLCLRSPPAGAGSDSGECLGWLDGKAPASVVYVCFGTQTHVSPEQLDKVVQGLYMSGHEFLLVARTAGCLPPPPPAASRRQGLIVRGWARQREVLVHRSTGGFVSHCGWNSMLDSLSAGGADSGLADDRRAVAEREVRGGRAWGRAEDGAHWAGPSQ
ncbi:unnamed protein product [Spirodela intermedia]|uniref:Glycosyltransferase N-terminal domain-containing protein n=1 Tax=Spirodela intermedia TaxID=51605 RepID=A0A7I8LHR1_SPIIN|nr:unnamed protein product [Spirodela intermedia]